MTGPATSPAALRRSRMRAPRGAVAASGARGAPRTAHRSLQPESPPPIMAHHDIRSAVRPEPDAPLVDIANYVADYAITSAEAYETARYCLLDSIACSLMAMRFPECVKMLGPIVPGATMPGGVKIPGTSHELDPVQAAFNIGAQVRWLDFNDTWLAAEWGHPSDNLGAILAVADFVNRNPQNPLTRPDGHPLPIGSGEGRGERRKGYTMRDVLLAMIKAHEIQGILALENSFNRLGLDHVLLVRIAS